MIRQAICTLICVAAFSIVLSSSEAAAQQAYGNQWARQYNAQDWQRMYYYPYVYYPHNYYSADYYKSSEDLYNRYPAEMKVPAYNKDWMNYYPSTRKFHSGNHFRMDIF